MVIHDPGGIPLRPDLNVGDVIQPADKRMKKSGTIQKTIDAVDNAVLNQPSSEAANRPRAMAGKRTIEERLEKNRQYAAEQQNNDFRKDFKICAVEDIPANNVPILPKVKKSVLTSHTEKITDFADVGIASSQGLRKTMEDAELAVTATLTLNNSDHKFPVIGIFDGDAGGDASIFVRDHLEQYLKAELQKSCPNGLTDDGIFEALKNCFAQIDRDYNGNAGTTANVILKLNGKLWVANVGDSRAILIKKDGQIVQASEDAKPNVERYREKIKAKGGYVIFGRVLGDLAVARAIGDKWLVSLNNERLISPNPKITNYPLDDIDSIIIACDGLYEVATTNEAGEAFKKMQGDSAEMKARRLVASALKQGSNDNVSVVVVKV